MKPIVFMFSGQGSQYFHMGKDLYTNNAVFKKHMHYLNEVAINAMGESVLAQLYNKDAKKSDPFIQTKFTHPALFMVQYSLAQTLIEMRIVPDFVLGTSLGEFVATAIAGHMPVEEIFLLVIKQAELLEQFCTPGGMLAILENSKIYNDTPVLNKNGQYVGAAFNNHFVVSGSNQGLKRIINFLKAEDIAHQLLPVSYAFHSSLIEAAGPAYISYLRKLKFKSPKIPLISCLHGKEINNFNVDYFWQVARKPTLIKETIQALESKDNYLYLDLGPSGTMSNFTKHNLECNSESVCTFILTPFGKDEKNLRNLQNVIENNTSIKCNLGDRMKVYVFPGQGSQRKGMGELLFSKYSEIVSQADEILGYSIKELCLEDPHNRLNNTEFTQPALYVINALSWLEEVSQGEHPDYVAGHSLGEYSALYAAGAFDFETGLRLVQERGRIMSQAYGGGMAAVIGLDEQSIKVIIKENKFSNISIANYNSPDQIVISGLKEEIIQAEKSFLNAGAKHYKVLPVSGAFHSKYMEEASLKFKKFLKQFSYNHLKVPVISNVTAKPYHNKDIEKLLTKQIISSVLWTKSIQKLIEKREVEFKEIGPGKVLTSLIRKIEKDYETKKKMNDKGSLSSINSLITAKTLGNTEFKKEYGLKYAYIGGGMYRGIASKEMVIALGKAGMMGYFGTGGLGLNEIEKSIVEIQNSIGNKSFGMNFLCNFENPKAEESLVDLFLKYQVKNIEAAAFIQMTPALVRYRLAGLSKKSNGTVICNHRIMGKVSRPEVATAFLTPAPERIVKKLLESGKITEEQADLSKTVPMADAICVEADSGGHTDAGVAYTLIPSILRLRDKIKQEYGYQNHIFVGAAGGIGTPEAAAAAFILGADFILTGSINQCTVEAGNSDMVKDMLQEINVQDTDYAPAADMFETGAKVQVLKKGVFFPARANKLFELYKRYNSIDEIDEKTKNQLQKSYFKSNFEDIYQETKTFFAKRDPSQIEKAEKNPKHKMALIFRWYLNYSGISALDGIANNKVNFQIHTGPALGAFNQWVRNTPLESWKNRHVDELGKKLMGETAIILNKRFKVMCN